MEFLDFTRNKHQTCRVNGNTGCAGVSITAGSALSHISCLATSSGKMPRPSGIAVCCVGSGS